MSSSELSLGVREFSDHDYDADPADKVGKAWDAMNRARKSYSQHAADLQHGIQPTTETTIGHLRWQLSELETFPTDSNQTSLVRLSTDSLKKSIESGKICAAVERELAERLPGFLAKRGIYAALGNWGDHGFIEAQAALLEKELAFLSAGFSEAAALDYTGKYLTGPYTEAFGQVSAQYQEQLTAVKPGLRLPVLRHKTYRNDKENTALKTLNKEQGDKIAALQNELIQSYRSVVDTTWDQNEDGDKAQTIALGLLDQPAYLAQDMSTQCVNAAFRMVYQGVTGVKINETDLQKIIKNTHTNDLVEDEIFLKFFQTPTFKERYATDVRTYQFAGMKLDTLAKMARQAKNNPQRKTFIVLSLQSQLAANQASMATKQHRVVLLGADETTVQTLDPAAQNPNSIPHTNPKQEFLRRWAATRNAGYMVTSTP